KAKHTGGFAVNGFVDACRLRRYLFIEAQTKLVRLSRRARAKSWLVHQAQGFETLTAPKLAVVEHLQKIHQTIAVLRGVIPKLLVASAPEVPSVAPHDFCEQTEGSAGKKSRTNKRLVSQRRERARLEVADFRDELVERLPFCFAFLTQQAKPPQVIESSFTQLFSRAPKQNRTAQRPCASD